MARRLLSALWSSLLAFFARIFNSTPAPSLPLPATAPSPPESRRLATPPTTPSSAVILSLDRSPTVYSMSDGSLDVISLSDLSLGPPDIVRLPSPWSPVGKAASPNVWLSVDGTLTNAAGPLSNSPIHSRDRSRTPVLSPWATSKISCASFYSSSSLDALGISVFVNLDDVRDKIDSKGDDKTDTPSTPKLNEVPDQSRTTITTPPRKRRETLPSVAGPNALTRATKYHSTPLAKLDNGGISHLCSASSISSMAYELRLGLFADGRSMTAIENIISLLDQASPELPAHNGAMQAVVEVL